MYFYKFCVFNKLVKAGKHLSIICVTSAIFSLMIKTCIKAAFRKSKIKFDIAVFAIDIVYSEHFRNSSDWLFGFFDAEVFICFDVYIGYFAHVGLWNNYRLIFKLFVTFLLRHIFCNRKFGIIFLFTVYTTIDIRITLWYSGVKDSCITCRFGRFREGFGIRRSNKAIFFYTRIHRLHT